MAHPRKVAQKLFGRRLRGRHQAPGAPFTPVALAELDIRQIGKRLDEGIIGRPVDVAVDVDHHRAPCRRPVADHLPGAIQRRVHQHANAEVHAQFPLDIRPRISSCRQLMYFSDHVHHSSGCSASSSA